MLAEVCCLFRKTNFASTRMEMLGYCPDTSVLEKFWKLCEQQLSISGKVNPYLSLVWETGSPLSLSCE